MIALVAFTGQRHGTCYLADLQLSCFFFFLGSFHILGNAGPSMQQDFYTVEGLATQLLSSAFINLNNIPDYRLRPMLRILPSLSEAR